MLILLHGPDSYRLITKRRQIVGEFLKKHSQGSIKSFDFENEEEREACREYVRGTSLFDSAKLAIVENPAGATKTLYKKLVADVETSRATMILSSPVILKKKDYPFFFEKPTSLSSPHQGEAGRGSYEQVFENVEGAAWKSFIKERARELDVVLAPAALEKLCRGYEKDAWGAVTELERLRCVGKSIEEVDVQVAVDAPEFFPLAMSLARGTPQQKTAALHLLLLESEAPEKVFAIVASLSSNKTQMAKYDVAIKSGKIEALEALCDMSVA